MQIEIQYRPAFAAASVRLDPIHPNATRHPVGEGSDDPDDVVNLERAERTS